ncbi:regulatory protein RecX [Qipengyuania gelatinilytica]|uniref:Regulatory protein RecX n=1 Tax=Qipengyuania gelatinilytica TaxID=2867231 RepID=A0ABX9A4R5_9SPHN|nr:regulatory protein RecX [Qipengyuania gelatinilytica]QZD96261.1 RecX family transcriptional regulator [Qipengyuania gelatinilytica]
MVEASATSRRTRRPSKPLDRTRLNDLALHYVARFATSTGKLRSYLQRKLRERGWEDDAQPDIEALVERFAEKGYVDDEAYARSKANGLLSRGYGARRVEQTLRAAGIEEQLRSDTAPEEAEARQAIVALAKRRRFGPFAAARHDETVEEAHKRREKQLAAMIRAGHSFEHARRVSEAPSIEDLENWAWDAQD